MGDYKINNQNSDEDKQTSDFLDKMYSNSLLPKINTTNLYFNYIQNIN